eukprot:Transcript_4311.p1 GENE.Transcript_4311~~Transcript_4311.p1  ORF type:complete len:682 (+),score=196.31 Transcript_4311:167-2212(+)
MAHVECRPYKHDSDDSLAGAVSFSLVFFFSCLMVFKNQVLVEAVGPTLSDYLGLLYITDTALLSVAMVLALVAGLLLSLLVFLLQLNESARTARRIADAERTAAAARGRMSNPPTCDWQLRAGNKYLAFLSHYKVEAGSDARYLSDLIQRMTGCHAYLDSTDLVDLRTLFNEGVHKTDVVFILATKGVFTRPWCLMEMWEAAVKRIPILLFPVVGGDWSLADTVTLLSDLMGQMETRNQGCMPELMEHVGKQGVTDVHEVEDVLLAHLGLVATLQRSGRPASADLDGRLCARLQINVAELDDWLAAQHARVEKQLQLLSWQSWGTDNQIIASVQTLVNEGAAVMGREPPEWTENLQLGGARGGGDTATGCLCWLGKRLGGLGRSGRQEPTTDEAPLLIVCAREESGSHLRLLQQEFGKGLRCEVIIGTDQVDTWRSEVERATRGVILLQTQSVLRDPVRLLQLFEATRRRHPLVCVNMVGGGYDFAAVKPLLRSLATELSQAQMAALRTELQESGQGVGQLSNSLGHAVPNAISVFFNPAAGAAMVDAAIKDILDKLERDNQLLQSDAIKEPRDVGWQGSRKKLAAVAAFGRGDRHLGDQLRKPDETTSVMVTKAGGEQVTKSTGKARAAESSSMASARAEVELVLAKPKAEQLTRSTSNSGAAGSSSMHAGASAEAESRI